MTDPAPTLTMRDIAALAHVSRPAVSMWRKRPTARGRTLPFPRPVMVVDRVERFDRDEVVAWLEQTGRGNNPEHAADAPAASPPLEADLDVVVALLALTATGVDEISEIGASALLAAAERVDPRDEFLLREVHEAAGNAAIRRYVDDLVESSFGPVDALSRIDAGRLRREAGQRGLAPEAVTLVRAVAAVCRTHLGEDVACAVSGAHPELVAAAEGFTALVDDGRSRAARARRRRAVVAGIDLGRGETSSMVRVLSVVGAEDEAALEAVDRMVLDLGPADVAVVIGASAILCDRLTGDLERDRAQTLRSERLVFAARLPRGLWRAAPRQSLALWVLAGGVATRRFRVADLTGAAIDETDLASDVTGALELTESRAFRYARVAELAPVLAGEAVVSRGVRAPRLGTPTRGDHVDRVRAASLTTSEPLDGIDVLVGEAPGSIVLTQRSLGELRDAGHLRMRRGSRVDSGLAHPDGTIRVVTAGDPAGGVRLDPFDAERHYGRAVRTEPGDVVFTERPRPRAHVDEDGGSIVASPSRILRLGPAAPVGPHALAAIINQQTSGEWETWAVPALPSGETERLDAALADVAAYLRDLEERAAAAHELRRALLDGVAAGTVTLDLTTNERG